MKIKLFLMLLMLTVSFAEDSYEKTVNDSLKDVGTKEKLTIDSATAGKEPAAVVKEEEEKKVTGFANVSGGNCVISVTNPNDTSASVSTEVVQYDVNGKRIKGMPYGFTLKGGETATRTAQGSPKTTRCDLTIKKSKVTKKVLTDEEKAADLEKKKNLKLELEKQIQELEPTGDTVE